jgi:hypothetical protein
MLIHYQWLKVIWELLFRSWLADGVGLHGADIAATTVVWTLSMGFTGSGATARAYVLRYSVCAFLLLCNIFLYCRWVNYYRFSFGIGTSEIHIFVFHATDKATLRADSKLVVHLSCALRACIAWFGIVWHRFQLLLIVSVPIYGFSASGTFILPSAC